MSFRNKYAIDRRQFLISCFTASSASLAGCKERSMEFESYPLSEIRELYSSEVEDFRHLNYKFRGNCNVNELVFDAFGEKNYVCVWFEHSRDHFFSPSLLSPQNRFTFASGFSRIPLFAKVTWGSREDKNFRINERGYFEGGQVIGNYTARIAERIPDTLLDDLRKDRKGSFRLKFRIHDDGLLIGWDIDRGHLPQGRREYPERFMMAGGDFREAEIFNGKIIRHGWYIHPITKEKILTDF